MGIRRRSLMVRVMAVVAVTLMAGAWGIGDTAKPPLAHGDSFNPVYAWSIPNTVADTPSDMTFSRELPEGDVFSFFTIVFFPVGWQVTPSDDVGMGVQRSTTEGINQQGFSNNPCNAQVPVSLQWVNATTDKSRTVTYENGFDDSNGDGNADLIDMYPDFNDRILGPAQPVMRQAIVLVPTGPFEGLIIQTLLYEPGTTIAGRTLDAALGQPLVAVSQNIGDPEAIRVPREVDDTDDCTLLSVTTLSSGTAEDGTILIKNPKEPGTYTFHALEEGLRDADGDGYENNLDPCPLDPDPTWDPRAASAIGPGDADGDGLPSSCDPDDSDPNDDEDGDAYLNRGDNCPTIANGVDQAGAAAGNQRDSDHDDIGDACDPNPDDADTEGEAPQVLLSQDVTITEGTAPPLTGSGGLPGEDGRDVPPWWYALAGCSALLAASGFAGLVATRRQTRG